MAKQRSSFAKLQRDKAKKERAAEKRAARLAKNSPASATEVEEVEEASTDDQLVPAGGELSATELMSLVETLHKKRATGAISEEEFEDAKVELLVRLPS